MKLKLAQDGLLQQIDVLFYQHGFTSEEIAEALSLKPSTVAIALTRKERSVLKEFEKRELAREEALAAKAKSAVITQEGDEPEANLRKSYAERALADLYKLRQQANETISELMDYADSEPVRADLAKFVYTKLIDAEKGRTDEINPSVHIGAINQLILKADNAAKSDFEKLKMAQQEFTGKVLNVD